jgi:threonine/homoserine/homoserine lactone efflux protein
MHEVLLTSFFLAFIAAITPGPLMTLIIAETLKYGRATGIKIALAPLLTDLPIMLASFFILSKLEHLNLLLGFISLLGACYLIYLAYGSITIKDVQLQPVSSSQSILKGIIANFLNPNPYIFYFSTLAPLAVKGMKLHFWLGPLSVFIFLGTFVLLLITIALSVHAARRFIRSQGYIYAIRLLGVLLFCFALLFIKDGIHFIKMR